MNRLKLKYCSETYLDRLHIVVCNQIANVSFAERSRSIILRYSSTPLRKPSVAVSKNNKSTNKVFNETAKRYS